MAWRIVVPQSFEQELPLAMLDPPGVSQIEANLHLAQLHTDLLEWDEGIKCVHCTASPALTGVAGRASA